MQFYYVFDVSVGVTSLQQPLLFYPVGGCCREAALYHCWYTFRRSSSSNSGIFCPKWGSVYSSLRSKLFLLSVAPFWIDILSGEANRKWQKLFPFSCGYIVRGSNSDICCCFPPLLNGSHCVTPLRANYSF